VLEASYHWTGERVRVTVRLMDVRDGASLWDYKCDEYCNDVFRAQDIISEKVTGALALKLTEEERKLLRKHYTENNEAYRLYLRGKYHLYRRTVPDNVKAAEYFQQAIDMDANYAAAYAGLADAYTSITLQGGRPPKDVLPKAKEALMRALEIDDLLAQAHFSMALFKGTDLDWSGAEKAYQRALELKPGDAATHAWYSVFLAALGRFDQALAECNRALEIEPLSSFANKNVGQILYQARRYDEAIEACNKAIELDPHFGTTYTWLAWSYEQKGLYDQSIEAIAKAYRYPPEIAAALKEAYVKSGWKGYWRKRLELAQERAKGGFVQPSGFAAIYARLGENDQAIEWLEKAYEERDSWLFSLKEHPEWDSLRSDPRFKDLLRRLRLAP
jgi:tetratricopeptide (TPR) repeat protein